MSGPDPTVQELRAAIQKVQDPEIGRSIMDLGLVYDVNFEAEAQKAHIRMTLTTPMCPYGPMIIEEVKTTALSVPGVIDAEIEIVWDPPWDPKTMATDDIKLDLGIW